MNAHLKREEAVYGRRWDFVHGGYFSNPALAAPLISEIRRRAGASGAGTIVDLGGGTGFLLGQLRRAGVDGGINLVNLDDSDHQLKAARATGIACVRGSVDSFSRRAVARAGGRCLFAMRSVLHYFGQAGLSCVLGHIRAEARPGEYFIHQTASFRRPEDADTLNDLYRAMGTLKWYPTVALLRARLRAEGWQTRAVLPAAPLPLTRDELMERYRPDPAAMKRVSNRLLRQGAVPDTIFRKTKDGFCACLHYWIYVCVAAGTVRHGNPPRS